MDGPRKRLAAAKHRGPAGRVLVVVAVLALAFWAVWREAPRTASVSLSLPADVADLSLDYEREGSTIRHAEFHWPEGAPRRLRHEPELSPGSYRLSATLRDSQGRDRVVRRRIDVDQDDLTRVDLR